MVVSPEYALVLNGPRHARRIKKHRDKFLIPLQIINPLHSAGWLSPVLFQEWVECHIAAYRSTETIRLWWDCGTKIGDALRAWHRGFYGIVCTNEALRVRLSPHIVCQSLRPCSFFISETGLLIPESSKTPPDPSES